MNVKVPSHLATLCVAAMMVAIAASSLTEASSVTLRVGPNDGVITVDQALLELATGEHSEDHHDTVLSKANAGTSLLRANSERVGAQASLSTSRSKFAYLKKKFFKSSGSETKDKLKTDLAKSVAAIKVRGGPNHAVLIANVGTADKPAWYKLELVAVVTDGGMLNSENLFQFKEYTGDAQGFSDAKYTSGSKKLSDLVDAGTKYVEANPMYSETHNCVTMVRALLTAAGATASQEADQAMTTLNEGVARSRDRLRAAIEAAKSKKPTDDELLV